MLARDTIVKDIGRLLFWYPVRWIVCLLPFSSMYTLGGILGWLDYHATNRRRLDRIRTNVKSIGSSDQSAAILVENRKNHLRNVLELIRYPDFSIESMEKFVHFSGLELLDAEIDAGKGVLLMTAHFGAKQLLQIALGINGYKVSQINHHMATEDLSYIQKKVSQGHRQRIEGKLPVKFLPATGFMRGSYECLKNNEILIIAGDGTGIKSMMDNSYENFYFLGKKMLFPTNNFALARRTSASIIPAFVVRNKSVNNIIFFPALEQKESTRHIMEQFIMVLEKMIRDYPDHWEFWEEFDKEVLLVE